MCVIIQKPAGISLKEEDIREAFRVNDDGFGFMYYDKEQDKIIAQKAVLKNPDDVVNLFANQVDKEVCYHFRFKTHGLIKQSQCHPFRVTEKKHGLEIYFMHNGVINAVSPRKDESDTQAFNNQFLFRTLHRNPEFLYDPAFKLAIESLIGFGNKLLFMDGKGRIIRFNETAWQEYHGCKVSNKNFVKYVAPPVRQDGSTNYMDNWPNMHDDDGYQIGYRAPATTHTTTYYMGGTPIAVQDKVLIAYRNDDTYYVEGDVVSVNNVTASIMFKDRNGVTRTLGFLLATGDSNYAEPGYQAMPMPKLPVPAAQTVEEAEGASSTPTATVLQLPAPVKAPEPDLNTKVWYGAICVDAKARWGGAFLDDSLQEYGKVTPTTILDFYNMDAQDRFRFFKTRDEEAFGMLQDLAERLVIEDQDADLVTRPGEENDADEDEDDTDEEEQSDLKEQTTVEDEMRQIYCM